MFIGLKNPCKIYLYFPHLMYDAASKAFSSYKLEINAQSVQINRTLSRANDQKIGAGVNIISLFYFTARFWHLLVK